ncbi:MAG TPA: saccharopine dehydrogenase NADP-binding domain-containing protein, partial [Jiangellaceae bacterium]|nr:saccharopine dehydrogenase NADP-binding domain-containing protein [Jiangellaceae bacterium]
MRVLVVGAGGVGAAIASIAARRSFFESLVVADLDAARADRAAIRARDPRISSARVDASDTADVVELATACRADVVVNACDPRFNPPLFDAAFATECDYLDM